MILVAELPLRDIETRQPGEREPEAKEQVILAVPFS